MKAAENEDNTESGVAAQYAVAAGNRLSISGGNLPIFGNQPDWKAREINGSLQQAESQSKSKASRKCNGGWLKMA
jgi:hypothetical protein